MRITAITFILLLLVSLSFGQYPLYPEERIPYSLPKTTDYELSFTEISSTEYDIHEGIASGNGAFILINWPYAYISCSVWGLMVWDISIPSSPSMLSHTYGFSTEPDLEWGLGGFDIYQDTLLVGALGRSGSQGFMIVNVADPYDPEVVFTYEICGYTYQTLVHGGFAYQPWADLYDRGLNGLISFDLTDPSHPVFADSIRTPGALAYWVTIGNNYAYVFDGYSGHFGVDIIDVTSPYAMEYDSFIPYDQIWMGQFHENYLYVIGSHGSTVYDVTNPTVPLVVATFPGFTSWKMTLDWPYLYCATGAGIVMVDISIPESTHIAGWQPVSQAWNGTGVSDSNLLFVSTYDYLKIFRWEETGIQEEPQKPEEMQIRAYPNPFNGSCRFEIPEGFDVSIYDLNGILVRRLDKTRVWDGRNTGTQSVPCGIYFVVAKYRNAILKETIVKID